MKRYGFDVSGRLVMQEVLPTLGHYWWKAVCKICIGRLAMLLLCEGLSLFKSHTLLVRIAHAHHWKFLKIKLSYWHI